MPFAFPRRAVTLAALALAACDRSPVAPDAPRPLPRRTTRTVTTSTGTISDLDVGNAELSAANGINEHGQIVGIRSGANFLWDPATQSLQTLPNPFGGWSIGYDINESGVVAGTSEYVAWYWTPEDGITHGLENTGAYGSYNARGINDAGQLTGSINNGSYAQPTFWDPAAGVTRVLSAGGQAERINNRAQMLFNGNYRAYMYDATTGVLTQLPTTIPGAGAYAFDINDDGTIAGAMGMATGWHAVIWSGASHEIRDLGTLGGVNAEAHGINARGDVVGWSQTADGITHAFARAAGGDAMIDIGTLGGGADSSVALKINDADEVVGWSSAGSGFAMHAARWLVDFAANANQAPVAVIAPVALASEGELVAFDGSASTDPDGDDLDFDWSFGDGGTATGPRPTHTYADNGSYTVTLRVTDRSGGSATTSQSVVVANAAPVVTQLALPSAPIAVGAVANITVRYADAGVLDSHSLTVDWGDGSSSTTVVSGGISIPAHAYGIPGVYTVTVAVTDNDHASGTRNSRTEIPAYVVVYDPAAGFVTGGGWIDSPAGACASDACTASTTGRATFGFVARYAKGASSPSGNTEFQFQSGGLRFSSTSYEWLVIAGARAQYKGMGSLNGRNGFSFLLTAIDGDLSGVVGPDRLRLKIWDSTTGLVVYDNAMGATDDSNVTTALGGGAISIKKS